MAKNQTVRIKPQTLQEDRDAFTALKAISTYAPANNAFAVAVINTAETAMNNAQAAEVQAQAALDAARDNAVAREWEYHNLLLGAKTQVIAQFGDDSNEVQAVGRKKKSEYKSPGKKGGAAKSAQ
jgi:hypothetical protein